MAKKTATSKELIKAAAIYRCYDKATGDVLGYLVPSNTTAGLFYQVTWNAALHAMQCNCKATKECCHIKAVKEICAIRRERTAACVQCLGAAKPASIIVEASIEPAAPALLVPPEIITYINTSRRTVQRSGELEPQYLGEDGTWHAWLAESGAARTVRFHAESPEERVACEAFMAAPDEATRTSILKRVWERRFAILDAQDAARAQRARSEAPLAGVARGGFSLLKR
jgi:hypothetical protein